jgi:hypothetical protein
VGPARRKDRDDRRHGVLTQILSAAAPWLKRSRSNSAATARPSFAPTPISTAEDHRLQGFGTAAVVQQRQPASMRTPASTMRSSRSCAPSRRRSHGRRMTDPRVDLGPWRPRMASRARTAHVTDAVQHGATLVAADVSRTANIFQRQLFPDSSYRLHSDARMRRFAYGRTVCEIRHTRRNHTPRQRHRLRPRRVPFHQGYAPPARRRRWKPDGSGTTAQNTSYAPYAGWKDSGYGVELLATRS